MQGKDHLAAIIFNAQAAMHYEAMIEAGVLPAELNDMPVFHKPAAPAAKRTPRRIQRLRSSK
jgi:hypothetical protein